MSQAEPLRIKRDDIVLSMPDYFDSNNYGWMPLHPYPAILVLYDLRDPQMLDLLQISEENKDCEALCSDRVINDYLVIAIGSYGKIRLGTLVHELVHARSFLYDYMGVYVDTRNDEAEAYMMGHMFNNCAEMIKLMDKRCRMPDYLERKRDAKDPE